MHCVSGDEISCKACGLWASEQTRGRGNSACCLVIVVIFVGLGGEGSGFEVIIQRREGEKPQRRGIFMGSIKKYPGN